MSFKVNLQEKEETEQNKNLFSDLFGIKSGEKLEELERSVDERHHGEKWMGDLRHQDSPQTAKFEHNSELLSNIHLDHREELSQINEIGPEGNQNEEEGELFFHKPKFSNNQANRKKR